MSDGVKTPKSKETGTCIYCGMVKPFHKEHYMPRALGAFRGLETLSDRICEDCNNCFSSLELEFLRTGPVGALRKLYGIEGRKHHKEHDPFWEWLGIIPPVEFYESPTGTQLESSGRKDGSVQRMRQIVIHDPQGQIHQIPISDRAMNDKEILRNLLSTELRRFNFANGPLVEFHGDQEEWQKIDEFISDLKLFRHDSVTWTEPTFTDQIVDVHAIMLINENHMRAVAKIVFHYFLKHFPRFGGHEPQFDEIRKFIKMGENIKSGSDIDRFIRIRPGTLSMSQGLGYMPNWCGHILAAGYDRIAFRGQAQFFILPKVNFIAPVYEVFLGENSSIVYHKPIISAHRFIYFEKDKKQNGYNGYIEETFPVDPRIWFPGLC